jgi:2'-5' RNA ligase
VRLFLAVDPDPEARRRLAVQVDAVRAALATDATVVRWTSPENFHVTLHFLGNVEPGRLDGLRGALGRTAPGGGFLLETGGVGAFPPHGAIRTVWLAIDAGRDRLIELHRRLGQALEAAGVDVSDDPLSPHLTVGRVRDRRRAGRVRRALSGLDATPISWTVDRVRLYASDLSGAAPRYRSLHEVHL